MDFFLVLIIVAFALVIAGLCVALFYRVPEWHHGFKESRRRANTKAAFKSVFGFVPSREFGGMRVLEQYGVDEVLEMFALEYKATDESQRMINGRQGPFSGSMGETLLAVALAAYEKKGQAAKDLVASRKKSFWNAHALAKAMGYLVNDQYTDYLPLQMK